MRGKTKSPMQGEKPEAVEGEGETEDGNLTLKHIMEAIQSCLAA